MSTVVHPVLAENVQSMIQATIVNFDFIEGIGPMTREDVEQHFQELAVRQWRRWDAARGCKFTSFLFSRLRGEAISMMRRYAAKTRTGTPRPRSVSLDAIGDSPRLVSGSSLGVHRSVEIAAESDDGDDQLNQLDLAGAIAQLPDRMRLVLLLLFYEALSEREAAVRLGMGLESLRALKDAALTRCRLYLIERLDAATAPVYDVLNV